MRPRPLLVAPQGGEIRIQAASDFRLPIDAAAPTAPAAPLRVPASAVALPAALPSTVKVSLHDCLACSGCVTSAETVLLESQSVDEVWARLQVRRPKERHAPPRVHFQPLLPSSHKGGP